MNQDDSAAHVVWGAGLALTEERKDFFVHVVVGTRPEQPLLTEFRSRRGDEFLPITRYLTLAELGVFYAPPHDSGTATVSVVTQYAAQDLDFRARLEELVVQHDTGIRAIRFWSAENPGLAASLNDGDSLSEQEAQRLVKRGDLAMAYDHRGGSLSFSELSSGTRHLVSLSWPLFTLSVSGIVVMIDEIDRSFHTELTRKLVERAYHWCEHGSQLVLTTHDTNLLDAGLFGHDGIWFMEKDPEGASHLWSLAEFDPDHLDALEGALEQGYLEGRFGAIPFGGRLPPRRVGKTAR